MRDKPAKPGLVVTRKVGEVVIIGDATVQLESIDRKQVRLRIVAPQTTLIVRQEIASDEAKAKASR